LGAYLDGNQVGFGRAITDRTVFAYLADVIIWPEYRGRGIGTRLVQALIDHPDCRTVIHWSLSTNDAHGLYVKARFQAIHQWPLYAARPRSDSLNNEDVHNPRLLQNRLTIWTRCVFGGCLPWRHVEASL
jgi:GNAT superfamily N-acetyltransferase